MANIKLDPEAVYAVVVRQLESWVASLPEADRDRTFAMGASATGSSAVTPQAIVDNVKAGTPLGEQFLNHYAGLAIASEFRKFGSRS